MGLVVFNNLLWLYMMKELQEQELRERVPDFKIWSEKDKEGPKDGVKSKKIYGFSVGSDVCETVCSSSVQEFKIEILNRKGGRG